MTSRLWILITIILSAALPIGCGDSDENTNVDGGGTPGPVPIPDPSDPDRYREPAGNETIAFGVEEGNFRNYFYRRGEVAAHVLTRSGSEPRIIAAFPADNQGIGVWFKGSDTADIDLWVGERDGVAEGGGLAGSVRYGSELQGVRARVSSDAESLEVYLSLLGNVRTLRDFGYGACLERRDRFPAFRNEEVEYLQDHNAARVTRTQIGDDYHMEYIIKGLAGTTVEVKEEVLEPRESCRDPAMGDVDAGTGDGGMAEPQTESVIVISGSGGASFDFVALTDDPALTPIDKANLVNIEVDEAIDQSFEFNALAFLSYADKLQAGSWRFLTYFGRDTMLSVSMLMPILNTDVVEAALASVLERINLDGELVDGNFDFAVEVGEVAHEEELGDFVANINSNEAAPPSDLRTPRYDYKMVDDDFMLALVMEQYIAKVRADTLAAAEEASEDALTADDIKQARIAADAAIAAFLARTRGSDNATYKEALEKNLALVTTRAQPFADDPQKANLVALKDGVPVGEWRDSCQGIGFGRYAFNVNAALVPGALAAAKALDDENLLRVGTDGGDLEEDLLSVLLTEGTTLDGLIAAWADVDELFRIELGFDTAQGLVQGYAGSIDLTDVSDELASEGEAGSEVFNYYAVSLQQDGAPVPVMHTDHGFTMLFIDPSEEYLSRVAQTITKTFPAGLMSEVGVMVANPAYATADFEVDVPEPCRGAFDGRPESIGLQSIFTNADYHGAVVWSWQQALLAAGIRHQLETRGDAFAAETKSALEQAECTLWETINKAEDVRAGELWSWAPITEGENAGKPEYRAFGYNFDDVDESNAAQLWSTVYLAIKEPERCTAAASGQGR